MAYKWGPVSRRPGHGGAADSTLCHFRRGSACNPCSLRLSSQLPITPRVAFDRRALERLCHLPAEVRIPQAGN